MSNIMRLDDDLVVSRYFSNFLLHKVLASASMTAWMVRRNSFDSKNGVWPGTIAMRNQVRCTGRMRATLLVSVWWFPKRNTKLQDVLRTWLRMFGGSSFNRSGTCLLPITVWDAPKSTTPTEPADAKHVIASCADHSAKGLNTLAGSCTLVS